jgi:PhnB protein
MAAQISSSNSDQVLHGVLHAENITIMGSDLFGKTLKTGNAIALNIHGTNEKEMNTIFDILSEEATVVTPLHQTFWGAIYGEICDKFGILWMFTISKN